MRLPTRYYIIRFTVDKKGLFIYLFSGSVRQKRFAINCFVHVVVTFEMPPHRRTPRKRAGGCLSGYGYVCNHVADWKSLPARCSSNNEGSLVAELWIGAKVV